MKQEDMQELIDNINEHPLTREIIKVFNYTCNALLESQKRIEELENRVKELEDAPKGFGEKKVEEKKRLEQKYNVKATQGERIVDVFQLHNNPAMNI